jgi:hypothetical protein
MMDKWCMAGCSVNRQAVTRKEGAEEYEDKEQECSQGRPFLVSFTLATDLFSWLVLGGSRRGLLQKTIVRCGMMQRLGKDDRR